MGCHFFRIIVSFDKQKLFSFMMSHWLIVLSACAIGILFRKSFPIQISSKLVPTFFSIRFSVSSFMLKFLIHLDLNFVHRDKYGSIWIFYMQPSNSIRTICWICYLSSSVYFWILHRHSNIHRCMGFCLSLQLDSTGTAICFCVNTTLVL